MHRAGHQIPQFLGARDAAFWFSHIRSAPTLAPDSAQRSLDRLGFIQPSEGFTEHHGQAEDLAGWIRLAGSRQIQRGAVIGLVDGSAFPRIVTGKCQTTGPDKNPAQIGQDVAVKVWGHHDIQFRRHAGSSCIPPDPH